MKFNRFPINTHLFFRIGSGRRTFELQGKLIAQRFDERVPSARARE